MSSTDPDLGHQSRQHHSPQSIMGGLVLPLLLNTSTNTRRQRSVGQLMHEKLNEVLDTTELCRLKTRGSENASWERRGSEDGSRGRQLKTRAEDKEEELIRTGDRIRGGDESGQECAFLKQLVQV